MFKKYMLNRINQVAEYLLLKLSVKKDRDLSLNSLGTLKEAHYNVITHKYLLQKELFIHIHINWEATCESPCYVLWQMKRKMSLCSQQFSPRITQESFF